mgnify:CR=1 FL=1
MKKYVLIIFTLFLSSNLFSQPFSKKGSFLMESEFRYDGQINKLHIFDKIGVYLSDGFALTYGFNTAFSEDLSMSDLNTIGARIHFSESQLLKIDMVGYESSSISGDEYYAFAGWLAYSVRYYFKDWVSVEPYTGISYLLDDETSIIRFKTGIGLSFHFEKW